MDPAIIGSCRIGYFRIGMGKHAINQWTALLKQFEGVASCEVTRRRLVLGARDSVTGWYEKGWLETTIKGVLIPRGATNIAVAAGVYVRLDALFKTADPVDEGDEIVTKNNIYYEVKGVKPYYIGEGFFHRDCDLTMLPLHELV